MAAPSKQAATLLWNSIVKANGGKPPSAAMWRQVARLAGLDLSAGTTAGTKTSGMPKGGLLGGFAYPSDVISQGLGIAGRAVQNYYKQKAAKQVARGNAPQHLAAAMSLPNSAFGNPVEKLTQVTADAGAAKAQEHLAFGDAVGGGLQDVSNFINTINSIRRLASGNALGAGALMALHQISKHAPFKAGIQNG